MSTMGHFLCFQGADCHVAAWLDLNLPPPVHEGLVGHFNRQSKHEDVLNGKGAVSKDRSFPSSGCLGKGVDDV